MKFWWKFTAKGFGIDEIDRVPTGGTVPGRPCRRVLSCKRNARCHGNHFDNCIRGIQKLTFWQLPDQNVSTEILSFQMKRNPLFLLKMLLILLSLCLSDSRNPLFTCVLWGLGRCDWVRMLSAPKLLVQREESIGRRLPTGRWFPLFFFRSHFICGCVQLFVQTRLFIYLCVSRRLVGTRHVMLRLTGHQVRGYSGASARRASIR